MATDFVPTKVLITVMTYPHPSRGYQELVCTAGITEAREWVRLYPIDYRYRPRHQQFRKYQWVEINLRPRGSGNDHRRESRQPDLDSLQMLGQPLPTKDRWAARRSIIDSMPHHSLIQLRAAYEHDQTSLGIVRPTRVLDLKVEATDPDWKPQSQAIFNQLRLFGPVPKKLRKIPYSFRYVFECDDSEKPHTAIVTDWELGVLFLKEANRLGSDEAAAESVKKKFLDELCRTDKDTRFFMGTVFPYNTWIVLGVFWPPLVSPSDPGTSLQGELPL